MINTFTSKFDLQVISSELIMMVIAIAMGLAVGAEREYSNKSAGLRTFILVSFGSCVFTILSIKIGIGNPDRLAANIITGIGFLGAGVIFKDDNKIGGITTATTIWAMASLGMSAGAGHIYLAIFGTVVVLIILRLLLPIQNYIDSHYKMRQYRIVTVSVEDADNCASLFRQYQLKYLVLGEQKNPDSFSRTWQVKGNIKNHGQLVAGLVNNPRIISYQF
jgi:putative Mg2+ transporter-C (MgtC) family protein